MNNKWKNSGSDENVTVHDDNMTADWSGGTKGPTSASCRNYALTKTDPIRSFKHQIRVQQ